RCRIFKDNGLNIFNYSQISCNRPVFFWKTDPAVSRSLQNNLSVFLLCDSRRIKFDVSLQAPHSRGGVMSPSLSAHIHLPPNRVMHQSRDHLPPTESAFGSSRWYEWLLVEY